MDLCCLFGRGLLVLGNFVLLYIGFLVNCALVFKLFLLLSMICLVKCSLVLAIFYSVSL